MAEEEMVSDTIFWMNPNGHAEYAEESFSICRDQSG
jgi:hypothetical protein